MEARAKGALVWSAWQFVLQPGWDNPHLADPPRLPDIIRQAAETTSPIIIKPTVRERERAHSQKKIRYPEPVRRPAYDAMIAHLLEKRQASQAQDGSNDIISVGNQAEETALLPTLAQHLIDPAEEGTESHTGYVLSFSTWPVRQGMRFLLGACCPLHRPMIQSLLDVFDPADFQERDMRALAALLLDSCGDEPDFLGRGSLMDRARLALLQARGQPLTLEEIARVTRLHLPELRRKMNRAIDRWVKLTSTISCYD